MRLRSCTISQLPDERCGSRTKAKLASRWSTRSCKRCDRRLSARKVGGHCPRTSGGPAIASRLSRTRRRSLSACPGVRSPSLTARWRRSHEATCISRVVSRMLSVAYARAAIRGKARNGPARPVQIGGRLLDETHPVPKKLLKRRRRRKAVDEGHECVVPFTNTASRRPSELAIHFPLPLKRPSPHAPSGQGARPCRPRCMRCKIRGIIGRRPVTRRVNPKSRLTFR